MIASVERLFLDDRVRVLGGFGFSYATIRDYTGKQVDALDADRRRHQGDRGADPPRRGLRGAASWSAATAAATTTCASASRTTRATSSPIRTAACSLDAAIDAGTVALGSEYDYVRAARRGARLLEPDARRRRPRARRPRRVRGPDQRHAVLRDGHAAVHRGSAHRPRRPPHAARVIARIASSAA